MTLARVLTAAILIPVVVTIVWWGPSAVVATLAGLVLLLALQEFFKLAERAGLRGYWRWTLFCAAGVIYSQWSAGQIGTTRMAGGVEILSEVGNYHLSLAMVYLIFLLGVAPIALLSRRPVTEILPAAAASAAAMVFIALPFSYLVRIDAAGRSGRQFVLFTLALIWAGDTGAYFTGRSIGRIPMAPALSPKKTWEGALGNVVASLIVAVFFARWTEADLLPMLALAAAANIAGQAGDLFESAFKRAAGVKDSGALLPGHGGMLDRIDSLIFAAPVVWCYVGWWSIRGLG